MTAVPYIFIVILQLTCAFEINEIQIS
jgi:hypothetical protein